MIDDYKDRDEPFEDENEIESFDQFNLNSEEFGEIVIAPTDWTIETIYSQIGRQIDLDPDFQRRNVWNAVAKSTFIESLFLGIPIPQILLSSKPAERNAFLVLDGKQRLLSIKEFLDGILPSGKPFELTGLRVLKELNGKTWEDIKQDSNWSTRLLNETQRTAVIRNWLSEAILYEIFYRLNSGSVKLSPMELRMSLHPGPFLKFIIKWSEIIGPLHQLISKKEPDPRMNDVELAVRHLAFREQSISYNGNLKKFLDDYCIFMNREFDANTEFQKHTESELDNMLEAIKVGLKIMGKKKFCRKYIGTKFETRFNRAIFDVQAGALSDKTLRSKVVSNPDAFENAFVSVSKNTDFVRATETTTKSNLATRTRFERFYGELENLYNVKLEIPKIS